MPTSLRDRVAVPAIVVSFALLLIVGIAGPSAAKPGLGPRGWAPGTLSWAPEPAVVTGLLWAAYLIGAAGLALHMASSPTRLARWRWPLLLGAVALLTGPFGSADHTNYAAYGRITVLGGDPYLVPPDQFHPGDPVLRMVEPPWTGTVSIYGPVATLLQAAASWLGGANLRETVWVWQALVVVGWLAVRALLLRAGAAGGRVDAAWTFNPLVFGIGVLGAHVDMIAAALALGTVLLAARSPVWGGLLMGLTASTKVTYGLVALAILVAWWTHERGRFARRAASFALPAVAVAAVLHVWAGPHVFDQLMRARRSISLATPWRLLFELLSGPIGTPAARTVVSWLAVALLAVLAWALARITRPLAPPSFIGASVRWTLVLTTAYTLAAPYSLPWYDLLTWATLPVLAASVLDTILVVRLAALAVAYVPGRVVGMTPRVERVTLAVRRRVTPYAELLVWGWLTLVAVRGSRQSSVPRPPGP